MASAATSIATRAAPSLLLQRHAPAVTAAGAVVTAQSAGALRSGPLLRRRSAPGSAAAPAVGPALIPFAAALSSAAATSSGAAALTRARLGGGVLGFCRSFASSSGAGPEERDLYKLLGVSRSAKADEIKEAYRKLALKWHPDRQSDDKRKEAEKMFAAIANAYQVLSDSAKRREYDSFGPSGSSGFPAGSDPFSGQWAHGGGGASLSQEDAAKIFKQVFGARGLPALSEVIGELFGEPQMFGAQLVVGDEVQVEVNAELVLFSCRESGIDETKDGLRKRALGRKGKILKVDHGDQTVKLSIPEVGDVWFGASAVRRLGAPKGGVRFGSPFAGFPHGGPGGFGGAGFGSGFSGGHGTIQMKQEMVTRPDGKRILRVTKRTVGPNGSVREEVEEMEVSQ